MRSCFPLAVLLAAAVTGSAAEPAADGFVPLFNGTDLTGWVNVNCGPDTFATKNGEVVTTGRPTGFLRTARQYENFVLEMDWLHENKTAVGNSGLFVWGDPLPAVGTGYTRGIEVQVLVNYPDVGWATNHGDLFSIWGAKCVPDRPHPKGYERCLPSENRCKGGGEWNHYTVTANDGVLKLAVNGKEVSGVSKCNPRKGYLALESEGAVCHFKNLRIKELPSTSPKPDEVAKADEGFTSLFDGLTLTGWKTDAGAWKAGDGVLRAAGNAPLATERKFGPFELVFDWKAPAKSKGALRVGVGGTEVMTEFDNHPGSWKRATIHVGTVAPTPPPAGATTVVSAGRVPGPIALYPADGLEIRNVFAREIKGN